MRPKVSVIMPVLNGQRFIGEAIRSIVAQSYRPVELVVVDDGSSDGTRGIVESFAGAIELKYVRHESPLGIPQSMNDGIRHSTGSLISFLDHDDAWLPGFLETQWNHLRTHPATGMVHSDFQTTDVEGAILEPSVARSRNRIRPSGSVFQQLFMDSFIVGNSVLIRRECFDRLGLFDERLRWGDYHMWLRIARHYPVDFVPDVLTQYRQHPTQSTRSSPNTHPYKDSVPLQALAGILELYPEARAELGETAINRRLGGLYFELACTWWTKQHFANARTCLAKAIALDPWNRRSYVLYAATLLGPSLASKLHGAWRGLKERTSPAGEARTGEAG